MSLSKVPSSFRDPSGFLFYRDNKLYRQINHAYAQHYKHLIQGGLYDELCGREMLVSHQEVGLELAYDNQAYKVIQPQQVPTISYPYEWSFSQLKDAALLTLSIQQAALEKNMLLKDASAYNVQFYHGRPVFIDTLSFESYEEGLPWVAYCQFCQHFLAPLALMHSTDIRLNQLLRIYIDGIPLDLACSLLPATSKLNLSLGIHLHLHARSQKKFAGQAFRSESAKRFFSKKSFMALLDSLVSCIKKMDWKPGGTEWYDYYEKNNNYGEDGLKEKAMLLENMLRSITPKTVWDLGSNTGYFSRIAVNAGAENVVSWDIDPGCVESNYRMVVRQKETCVLPLLLDITNPSPGIGWDNHERLSMRERSSADAVLALGLIHHLAIANNVSFARIADFFCKLAPRLILEFVPKDDSQVQKLLASRDDIFSSYTPECFEENFKELYVIEEAFKIPTTKRILYSLKRRNE